MKYYKKLASDTGLMMIGSFSTKVLIFLLLPLYTSVLSTEEYGIVDLFTVTVSLLIPFLTLSIADATFRFAFDNEVDQKKNLMASVMVIICSGFVLVPIVKILELWNPCFNDHGILFCLLYLTNAFQTCFANYARGIGEIKVFVVSGIVYTLILLLLNILLLTVLHLGLQGYLLSLILAFSSSSLFIFLKIRGWNAIRLRYVDYHLIKQMIRFSFPIVFSTIGWWAMNSIDKYMIVDYFGMDQSGLYAVAQKIPTIISTIGAIFVQAWQISAISAYGDKDSDELYTNVYRFYQVALFLTCSIIILLTKPLASILFQNEYYGAYRYAPILVLSGVFSCLASFLQSPFVAAKKSSSLMQSTLIGLLFNIVGNAVLLRIIGVIGATYATLLGFMLTWGIRLYCSRKIKRITVNWPSTISSIVILFLEALLVSYDVENAMLFVSILTVALVVMHIRTINNFLHSLMAYLTKKKNELMKLEE